MFAQVQDQRRASHLQVHREILSEAMFPIGFETQEIKVKLRGLGFVKDADDGSGGGYVHELGLDRCEG
ncbi:hypothetical protein D3C81_2092960 [compost metagenome]